MHQKRQFAAKPGQFSTMVASSLEHEKVFVEIYFEDRLVAWISQEEGLDNLMLETPDSRAFEDAVVRKVELSGFLAAVDAAVMELRKG